MYKKAAGVANSLIIPRDSPNYKSCTVLTNASVALRQIFTH